MCWEKGNRDVSPLETYSHIKSSQRQHAYNQRAHKKQLHDLHEPLSMCVLV